MKPSASLPARLAGAMLFVCALAAGQTAPQLVQLNPAQLWQRVEFQITNVPPATNPFDPEVISLDGTFVLPSGRTMTVPAFWYQAYTRLLSEGNEYLTAVGAPCWRLRFTPPEPGSYSLTLTLATNQQPAGPPVITNFTVPEARLAPGHGYVQVAFDRQHFQTGDGQPLPLVGHNVCWPQGGGTFNYETWFAAMQNAGENYARIWMCPWAFGVEAESDSLTHYTLDNAWALDYVFNLAEQKGIYLLLCLEYHGMFADDPAVFGANTRWPLNPYNLTNGGPCLNQNAFFTNTAAHTLYQKRLRYIIGRYGYSPNLFAWEFFNEIDNVYRYLAPADVAAWHARMGDWMHLNDTFGHLVTTSFTSGSDRPEIWSLPQMDFAAYHSYNEATPAVKLSKTSQYFLQRYRKPVMIGEYGIDWRGWRRSNDPYLRGLRQGLWGGALGGSTGTAMSWWWENIDAENVYPFYSALSSVLKRTGWGHGAWSNILFQKTGPAPPTVSELVPGGVPFDAFLPLSFAWGGNFPGRLALPNPVAAGASVTALNGFIHGSWHDYLRTPFQLSAWLTNDARLVLHLNSVSDASVLTVCADGMPLFATNLPNIDGLYTLTNEYNLDFTVALPPGKRLIEVTNTGGDWCFLDWVRLENILPSSYPGDWKPSPEAIGLRGARESLLYVVAPYASFPTGATNNLPVQQGLFVTLTNWPAGTFFADWYDPASGTNVGYSQGVTTNRALMLLLPNFSEDLAGALYPPPTLTPLSLTESNGFSFRLDSETGGRYLVEKSADLWTWSPLTSVTNVDGSSVLRDPSATNYARTFYRASRVRAGESFNR